MKLCMYLAIVASLILAPLILKSQPILDLETGLVFTGYNNVQIPGDKGTRFSLKDDLKPEVKVYYRLRASYTLKLRHTFSLLYAPLTIKSQGKFPKDLFFEDRWFSANVKINARYTFNSYRLTYRYTLIQGNKLEFGLGFTAKIRDAKIELVSPTVTAAKANVGFVPIINFRLLWKLNETFGLLLDGDALAAKQGRAEDVLVAIAYKATDHINFRLGYRILEGGADNDEVYNFTLLHYASLGFSYTF